MSEEKKPPFITYDGEKDRTKYRKMAFNIPDGNSCNTRIRTDPATGQTTMLRTRGGSHEVTTTGKLEDKERIPCKDYKVEQTEVIKPNGAIDTKLLKRLLKDNPNTLYGKQIELYNEDTGERESYLHLDHNKATLAVDVPSGDEGKKDYSLPAAEGDTHYVKFPWHKEGFLLFGRDKNYCPRPDSSIKAGMLNWVCGIVDPDSGKRKVFVFGIVVRWELYTHFDNIGQGKVTIEVYEEDNPSVVICSVVSLGAAPQRVFVNQTPDGQHAVVTLTRGWPLSMNNFNINCAVIDQIDAGYTAVVEFEVTMDDGKPVVKGADLITPIVNSYDGQITKSLDGYSFMREYAIDEPNAYLKPYTWGGHTKTGSGEYAYVVLAGYDTDGNRKLITTYFWLEDTYYGYKYHIRIYCNADTILEFTMDQGSWGISPDWLAYLGPELIISGIHVNTEALSTVAVTNNMVALALWRNVGYKFEGLPFPSYDAVDAVALVSISGDLHKLDAPKTVNMYPPSDNFVAPSLYDYWQWLHITRRHDQLAKVECDARRAGVSWNPISGEFSVTSDSRLPIVYLGTKDTDVILGTGFVGTTKGTP